MFTASLNITNKKRKLTSDFPCTKTIFSPQIKKGHERRSEPVQQPGHSATRARRKSNKALSVLWCHSRRRSQNIPGLAKCTFFVPVATLRSFMTPGGLGWKCASHRAYTGSFASPGGNRKSEQTNNLHQHNALLLSAKTADFLGCEIRI